MSLRMPKEESKGVVNMSQLRSNNRRNTERKGEKKLPRKGDLDVKPAPDSKLVAEEELHLKHQNNNTRLERTEDNDYVNSIKLCEQSELHLSFPSNAFCDENKESNENETYSSPVIDSKKSGCLSGIIKEIYSLLTSDQEQDVYVVGCINQSVLPQTSKMACQQANMRHLPAQAIDYITTGK